MAEVSAIYQIALSNPRDDEAIHQKVMKACQNLTLAESALYTFRRGGTLISGPSIRLIETIASKYGRLNYGWKILGPVPTGPDGSVDTIALSNAGYSEVGVWCIDMEALNINGQGLIIPHVRKAHGKKELIDSPDDVYYHVANLAVRRMRKQVERCLDFALITDAVRQVGETLKHGHKTPLKERIGKMLEAFSKDFKVTREQIEARMQCAADSIDETQMVHLRGIYTSLKDGASKPDYWFEKIIPDAEVKDLTEEPKKKAGRPGKKEKPVDLKQEEPETEAPIEAEALPIAEPEEEILPERYDSSLDDDEANAAAFSGEDFV